MRQALVLITFVIGFLWCGSAFAQEVPPQEAPPTEAAVACPVGGEINVLWNGSWYPATIKEGPNDQSQCFIGYDGYASSWDEWVGADRMAPREDPCPVGSSIQVLWNGTWYAATIKAGPNAEGQCQIGYDGWDDNWDEWVGDDRMRPPE